MASSSTVRAAILISNFDQRFRCAVSAALRGSKSTSKWSQNGLRRPLGGTSEAPRRSLECSKARFRDFGGAWARSGASRGGSWELSDSARGRLGAPMEHPGGRVGSVFELRGGVGSEKERHVGFALPSARKPVFSMAEASKMSSGAASGRPVEPAGAASSVSERLRACEAAPQCPESAELNRDLDQIGSKSLSK